MSVGSLRLGLRLLLCTVLVSNCMAFFMPRISSQSRSSALNSQSSTSSKRGSHHVPSFLTQSFNTECDNTNRPPSLNILLRSLQQLTHSGSDIRGYFVDHNRFGSLANVAHEVSRIGLHHAPLTPMAAFCFGHGLADQLVEEYPDGTIEIAIGRDPRSHGTRLADSFARGAESVDPRVRVVYTGISTTPGCAAFCHLHNCHAAVMVTASHLPSDRNGFKIFYRSSGGMTRTDLHDLGGRASSVLNHWFSSGILPPSSGGHQVSCTKHANYMPAYAESLRMAVESQVGRKRPLEGLNIVFNPGNGAGGFFHEVLKDLGADVSGSIQVEPDETFPKGVPNPEYEPMLRATIEACEAANADCGIMLDTDADRCGFVVPNGSTGEYEPLNRNRLIALLGVLFAEASPGCAFVTDSVTSEGLTTFLENLGLTHVRYIKGYMNVISKARELQESGELNAEVAIETSGHCAMKENNFLDDGTYTAVKVVSLLARKKEAGNGNLLDSISSLNEMGEIKELRMNVVDESLETLSEIFDFCALAVEQESKKADNSWEVDTANLEGIRVRTGHDQFLMLRKSLHDPIMSLQLEARSVEDARKNMVQPLVKLFEGEVQIAANLDLTVLKSY